MHSEGGMTALKICMVKCRTCELHDQGLAGTEGACRSLTPENAISIGRGLRHPPPPDLRLLNADKISYINRNFECSFALVRLVFVSFFLGLTFIYLAIIWHSC